MSVMSGVLGMHGHASDAESHGARGDTRALPHREVGLETPKPFSAEWRARWHGAHGDARAVPHWEAGLEL
jgi:hypothetical protein